MTYKLLVSTKAQKALSDIAQWYENQSPGLGNEFITEFESTLSYLKQFPGAFTVIDRKLQLRQIMLRRFPYLIVFGYKADTIIVGKLFHAHRHPAERVKKRRDL